MQVAAYRRSRKRLGYRIFEEDFDLLPLGHDLDEFSDNAIDGSAGISE